MGQFDAHANSCHDYPRGPLQLSIWDKAEQNSYIQDMTRRFPGLPPVLIIALAGLALGSLGATPADDQGAADTAPALLGPLPAYRAFSLLGPKSQPAAAQTPPEQRDPRFWAPGYYSGDALPPHTVYLTFDDGPCDFTGQIVDILKQEGVRATFFINGFDKDAPKDRDTDLSTNHLAPWAEVLGRLVANGNVIGNHTLSHRDLTTLSPAEVDFQLSALQQELGGVLGKLTPTIHLVRPPYGSPWLGNWNTKDQRQRVASELRNRAYVMMWTTGWDSGDSLEWVNGEWYKATSARYHPGGQGYQAKIQRGLDRIFRQADGTASGVVLLHDVHPTSRDMLVQLIRGLKQRGYDFATLEDYCVWRWGPAVFAAMDARSALSERPTPSRR
jgi:peptidoglycan/xylan/chitin deacetylase (PgdA/CDA1 family)